MIGNDICPPEGRVYVLEGVIREPSSLRFSQPAAGPLASAKTVASAVPKVEETELQGCWVWSVERSLRRHCLYHLEPFVHKHFADICGQYQAHRRAMIGAETKMTAIFGVQRHRGPVIVVCAVLEGFTALLSFMVITPIGIRRHIVHGVRGPGVSHYDMMIALITSTLRTSLHLLWR